MKQYKILRFSQVDSPNGTEVSRIQARNGRQALKEFNRFCMFYRASLNVPFAIKLGIQRIKQ